MKTSPNSLKKPTSVFGSILGSGPGYEPGSGSGSSSLSGCSSFDQGVYDNGVYDTKYGLSREDMDINPIRNYDLYDKKYGSSCREEIGVFERGNRDEIGVFDSDLLRDGEGMGRDRSKDKDRDRERSLGSSGGIGGSAMLSQQSPLQALWTTANPRELQEDLQDLGVHVVESYFNPPLMAVKKWAKRSTSHR
jgi:hypothetical protein